MMPVKRKRVHVFHDPQAKKRQQKLYQENPVKPWRVWPDAYSMDERETLQVTAERVLNGHDGLNLRPVSPEVMEEV